ncbi:hypothetical protein M0811_04559 [Anaeramoeba ignava]|uniref:Uncharacterized protein n=1 Tax=Anaeramoeba ignava TaxID=1746090 RepID=A0A9Q0RFF8_ANAIG|nr:hypothetical protein M0811_04559 [Anaeramoeba ignava]
MMQSNELETRFSKYKMKDLESRMSFFKIAKSIKSLFEMAANCDSIQKFIRELTPQFQELSKKNDKSAYEQKLFELKKHCEIRNQYIENLKEHRIEIENVVNKFPNQHETSILQFNTIKSNIDYLYTEFEKTKNIEVMKSNFKIPIRKIKQEIDDKKKILVKIPEHLNYFEEWTQTKKAIVSLKNQKKELRRQQKQSINKLKQNFPEHFVPFFSSTFPRFQFNHSPKHSLESNQQNNSFSPNFSGTLTSRILHETKRAKFLQQVVQSKGEN